MLIDTHAHLNFNAFKDDADEIIDQCFKNDIWMINVGSQFSTSKRAVQIAEKYSEGVYAAIGLHPIHAIPHQFDVNEVSPSFKSKPEEFDANQYRELAKSKKVVALGEIGLDYSYAKTGKDKEAQKKAFISQLELAKELSLPVIIHCREAWTDLIKILKLEIKTLSTLDNLDTYLSACRGGLEIRNSKLEIRGVAHFFSGTIEDAQKLLNMGFLMSFTGVITFTKDYDKVIKEIPLEKIMVETDCPYVTPVPFRGKRNLPLYVEYVAQKIAEIKNVSFEEVVEQTTKNAQNLFKI
ncbi:TatD family deoxyribonuclease [bacterium]|nr:MAG: TatD family deoxyribonuclease [bacterium]